MKKSLGKVLLIILIIVLVIVAIGFGISKKINDSKKNYEIVQISDYKYFVAKENNKYGVIGKQGNTIIECKFDKVKIPNPEQPVFICYEGNITKVYNENAQEILDKYENVEPLELKDISGNLMYEKSVLKYSEKGQDNSKYGIINFSGKKLTKAVYDDIDTLQAKEGNLLVKANGKYGVININGATVIDTIYDKIDSDKYYDENDKYKYEGYITCNISDEGYRYGYINSEGKKLVDTLYNELYRIPGVSKNDVYLICAQNGKYGLLKNDEKIIENDYQSLAYNDSNDTITAQKGKKYGVISMDGKVIVPCEYKQIDVAGDYLYATSNDNSVKAFDNTGKESNISPNLKILNTENVSDKIYVETSNNKTIYSVYKDGKKVTDKDYLYIQYLFDNYFISCESIGKLGIIDDNGDVKVDMIYSSVQKIDNTKLVQVQGANNKIAIFSSNMSKIVELDNASLINEGDYIKIYNKDEAKYVSNDGRELSNTELFSKNKIFAKKLGNKWGFVDSTGSVLVDYKYDRVTEINEYGFAGIELNGKWGVINDSGNVIVEPKYEFDTDSPEFIGEYYKLVYGNGEVYYTK